MSRSNARCLPVTPRPANYLASLALLSRGEESSDIRKNPAGLDYNPELPHDLWVRLWTIHPCYLDAKGLVTAWREALLAQKVLAGHTRGYTHHPQLARFRSHPRPLPVIAAFLLGIAEEAQRRGYRFDTSKISPRKFKGQIDEHEGQLLYEWKHLLAKLRLRSPYLYRQHGTITTPEPHPLFRIVPGGVNHWERT